MKQTIKAMVSSLVLTAGVISTTSQAATLEEIYLLALENDNAYKSALANYEADKEAKALGRAGLLPKINGQLDWTNSDINDTNNNFSGQLGEVEKSTTDSTRSGYIVNLEQPLFNMNAWHTFKTGKLSAAIATTELSIAAQDLILRTANAYFDVLEAHEGMQTAESEEKALKQRLDQSTKRFEVGLTAITEVHEAQAAYDGSIANRLTAEGLLTISFEALEVITGKPIYELAPLKEDFPVVPPSPEKRSEWVAFSLQNNLPLQISEISEELSLANAKSKRANHYPTVSVNALYQDYGTENDNTFAPITPPSAQLATDSNQDTFAFGVTVQVPLYNGGGVSASRRQAYSQHLSAQELLYKARRDVTQQARTFHLAVKTGVATVKARKQAITSAQSALDATQSGYEVGTRDLVDVLTVQNNLYSSERDYQQALYSYIINSLTLKQVAGNLQPSHISELNQWLDPENKITYSFQ